MNGDRETSDNVERVYAPPIEKAYETCRRMVSLPEVSQTLTLNSLIPSDQDQKIAALTAASQRLGPALNPPRTRPAPSDQENIAAIQPAAAALSAAAGNATGPAADSARDVAVLLLRVP